MSQIVYFDADALTFPIAAAYQERTLWPDGVVTVEFKVYPASTSLRNYVDDILATLEDPTEVFMCFGDPDANFRKFLYPEYKAHRSLDRPVGLPYLEEYLRQNYACLTLPEMEADDVCSYYATQSAELSKKESHVVSRDKDFLTIPGVWVTLLGKGGKLEYKRRFNSRSSADYHWMLQTLMGDQTDGYPGLKGVGEVRAKRILASGEDPVLAAEGAYLSAGHSSTEFDVQATLARLLRFGDQLPPAAAAVVEEEVFNVPF